MVMERPDPFRHGYAASDSALVALAPNGWKKARVSVGSGGMARLPWLPCAGILETRE